MKIAQPGDGRRPDQRRVAGEHQNIFILLNVVARAHDGVTCAALFCLKNEFHAGVRDGGADLVRLMTYDHINIVRGNDLHGRSDHVRQQRLAANVMKNFCALGFEPGPFAGRHDYDSEAGGPFIREHHRTSYLIESSEILVIAVTAVIGRSRVIGGLKGTVSGFQILAITAILAILAICSYAPVWLFTSSWLLRVARRRSSSQRRSVAWRAKWSSSTKFPVMQRTPSASIAAQSHSTCCACSSAYRSNIAAETGVEFTKA